MVHPVPRKLAGHPWPAHAIFFNGLKFRVEFRKKLLRVNFKNSLVHITISMAKFGKAR
jgi:hypothetical protein